MTGDNSSPSLARNEGDGRDEVDLRAQGEAQLLEAYQDWRRLGELEGEGIRTHDWTLVEDCQKKLSTLQSRIIRLTSQARDEWRSTGADLTEKENNLRQTVSSLIELEMQNSSSLTAAKEATRTQLDQADVIRQNLKRVHRTYSAVSPAVWNSFS
jgi:hypothetical protein